MKVNVFLASVASALISVSPAAFAAAQPVTLNFQATVNGKAFDCQQDYTNIGTQKSTVQVQDFRLYVSGLRLVNEQGAEVPLTLDQNPFQYQNVALLDFENATGMPQGYFIHLGSTECLGSAKGSTPERATEAPLQCERPNRPTITLDGFAPEQSQLPIRLDLGRLLSTSNVNQNQPQTAAGCMAGKDDTDCAALFEQLGLGQGPQQFFFWETEVTP